MIITMCRFQQMGPCGLTLFEVNASYGEIGCGMDTMSTDSSDLEYISRIDFAPISARYLCITASGGDNLYAASELQVYGTAVASVTEPCTMLLLGSGLLGLACAGRKRHQQKKLINN